MGPYDIEPIKRLAQKSTGVGVPAHAAAHSSIRPVRPARMRFRDDGYVPNNRRLALLLYRKALRFTRAHDPAATLEVVFHMNGWGNSWRDGIYEFVHYHSMIHEVLGVAKGSASLRLGGNKGKTVKVGAGDVIVVPAGVGHECMKASPDFLVVGAYPPTGTYDECRGSFQERDKAMASIRRVRLPKQHPLFGTQKPLW